MAKLAEYERYMKYLCEALGHQDRHIGFSDYSRGLMLPIERKSVELLAAQGTYDIADLSNGQYTLSNNLIGGTFDAKFVNPVGRDFRLQTGSSAIDNGYPNGLATDAGGWARPVGAGIDIGAYEYAPACGSR